MRTAGYSLPNHTPHWLVFSRHGKSLLILPLSSSLLLMKQTKGHTLLKAFWGYSPLETSNRSSQ